MVGAVVKTKIGELEEGVRAGRYRRMGNVFTGVLEGFLVKKRFLLRFQYGCEKNLSSNQITTVIVEKIPEEKEPEVSAIPEIPEEQVELDKGYYRYFCIMLWFLKEVGVDSN